MYECVCVSVSVCVCVCVWVRECVYVMLSLFSLAARDALIYRPDMRPRRQIYVGDPFLYFASGRFRRGARHRRKPTPCNHFEWRRKEIKSEKNRERERERRGVRSNSNAPRLSEKRTFLTRERGVLLLKNLRWQTSPNERTESEISRHLPSLLDFIRLDFVSPDANVFHWVFPVF